MHARGASIAHSVDRGLSEVSDERLGFHRWVQHSMNLEGCDGCSLAAWQEGSDA